MQKLRTMWHVFKHSIFPFDYYYHKVRKVELNFSLRYFISLVILVSASTVLLKTVIFVASYPPKKLNKLIVVAEETFPEDLVITINNNGRLTTNYDRPYILFSPLENNPQSLLVIDPKAQRDKINEYGANVLFMEREFVIKIQDQIYEFPYKVADPLRIDYIDVMMISQNAQIVLESYWVFILVILAIGIFIAPPLIIIANLVILTFASIFFFFALKLKAKKKKIPYTKTFQISLHSITAPFLLQCIMFLIGVSTGIAYWYTILAFIFLGGGLYEAYFEKKKVKR